MPKSTVLKSPILKWPGAFEWGTDLRRDYLKVPFKILKLLELHLKISKRSLRYYEDVYLSKGDDVNMFVHGYLNYFQLNVNEAHISMFWKECVLNCEDDDDFIDDDFDDYYI